MGRLVINGEEVYELDEKCLKEKQEKSMQSQERYRYSEHPEGKKMSAGNSWNLSCRAAADKLRSR